MDIHFCYSIYNHTAQHSQSLILHYIFLQPSLARVKLKYHHNSFIFDRLLSKYTLFTTTTTTITNYHTTQLFTTSYLQYQYSIVVPSCPLTNYLHYFIGWLSLCLLCSVPHNVAGCHIVDIRMCIHSSLLSCGRTPPHMHYIIL